MSLESILDRIINEANIGQERIIGQARLEAVKISGEVQLQARQIYDEDLRQAKAILEGQKQKLIVSARLESRKGLLRAKQELIRAVFDRLKSQLPPGQFKKERVLQDKTEELPADMSFYLDNLRHDCEADVAQALFE